MNEQSLPIQEITELLWRRRGLIAVVFAVGLVTVVVLAWLQAPTYRAAAKLMVTSARATITVSPDANERPRVDPVTEADLASEVSMLSSMSLLREVLEQSYDQAATGPPPGLFTRVMAFPYYLLHLPGQIYRAIHRLPPESGLDLLADETSKRLSVTPVGRSNIIDVAFEDRRPAWAAELVNNLVSHHVERHVRLNQQASAQQFYESQRALLTDKLHDAETALGGFYEREGIDSTGTGLPALRDRVLQLETALADAETELAESTAEADYLGRAMTTMPKDAAPGPVAGLTSSSSLIKNRIVELELQRSQLLSQFAPTSMKVSDLDRQIAEARRLFEQEKQGGSGPSDPARQTLEANLTQTQARAAALQARAASLRAQLDASRTQLAHLDSVASSQERLEQEVKAAKESLATYLKKAEEARFSNALDESRFVNVVVIDRATVPTMPQASKRTMTIALGAVISLVAGIGLAFVRDRLDASVKSGSEARRISGLPLLAEIPS